MGHSENCTYSDDDALLYCILRSGGHEMLLSAREADVFDQYLEYAKHNDKELSVDMESADHEPLSIIYGGLMMKRCEFDKIRKIVEDLKDYAFLDLDRDKENLAASCYKDIVFFPEHKKHDNFIPFAALMQTTHPFDNDELSVTMFPMNKGNLIWECMAGKQFLLACRKKVAVNDETTVDNWKNQINMDELMAAYQVADLYTGPLNDEPDAADGAEIIHGVFDEKQNNTGNSKEEHQGQYKLEAYDKDNDVYVEILTLSDIEILKQLGCNLWERLNLSRYGTNEPIDWLVISDTEDEHPICFLSGTTPTQWQSYE